MLLSVIIPVYNCEDYLETCLNSVLNQSFSDFEVILVDDGSKDDSLKICNYFASEHSNIKVFHQQNKGAASARNKGILEACGEYIHFIDSDDKLPDSEWVYKEVFDAIGKLKPDIIFSLRERFDEKMKHIEDTQQPYIQNGPLDSNILYTVLKHKYTLTMTCPVNKIIKRLLLIENDLYFFEGLHHEEDEWLPRVISKAKSAFFYNEILYCVRHRADSLSAIPSHQNRFEKARDKIKIAVSGLDFMKAEKLDNQTMRLSVEYYTGYFTAGIAALNLLGNDELKKQLRKIINQNWEIWKRNFSYLRKNQKILYLISKIFGKRFGMKLLCKRYKG